MTETNEKTYQVSKQTANAIQETFWKVQTLAKTLNMVLFGQSERNPEAEDVNACELSQVLMTYVRQLDDALDLAEQEEMKYFNAARAERIKKEGGADPDQDGGQDQKPEE